MGKAQVLKTHLQLVLLHSHRCVKSCCHWVGLMFTFFKGNAALEPIWCLLYEGDLGRETELSLYWCCLTRCLMQSWLKCKLEMLRNASPLASQLS